MRQRSFLPASAKRSLFLAVHAVSVVCLFGLTPASANAADLTPGAQTPSIQDDPAPITTLTQMPEPTTMLLLGGGLVCLGLLRKSWMKKD